MKSSWDRLPDGHELDPDTGHGRGPFGELAEGGVGGFVEDDEESRVEWVTEPDGSLEGLVDEVADEPAEDGCEAVLVFEGGTDVEGVLPGKEPIEVDVVVGGEGGHAGIGPRPDGGAGGGVDRGAGAGVHFPDAPQPGVNLAGWTRDRRVAAVGKRPDERGDGAAGLVSGAVLAEDPVDDVSDRPSFGVGGEPEEPGEEDLRLVEPVGAVVVLASG